MKNTKSTLIPYSFGKPENQKVIMYKIHATKKMYLTVSHLPDRKLNFSYHYQTAELTEKDAELMYYYMMRILFRGIEDPGRTINEIIDMI